MGKEIERKFLVKKDAWERAIKGERHYFEQGYLVNESGKVVRIRLTDTAGYITIKGAASGATRPEYEYAIPEADSRELLSQFCTSIVKKIRHKLLYKNKVWEIDEYLGDNEGLITAEIELKEENELFELPGFIDEEVTGISKYYNSSLSVNPYKKW